MWKACKVMVLPGDTTASGSDMSKAAMLPGTNKNLLFTLKLHDIICTLYIKLHSITYTNKEQTLDIF